MWGTSVLMSTNFYHRLFRLPIYFKDLSLPLLYLVCQHAVVLDEKYLQRKGTIDTNVANSISMHTYEYTRIRSGFLLSCFTDFNQFHSKLVLFFIIFSPGSRALIFHAYDEYNF